MCTNTGKGEDISALLSAKILSYASLARPIVLVFNLFIFFKQLSGVKSKVARFIAGFLQRNSLNESATIHTTDPL